MAVQLLYGSAALTTDPFLVSELRKKLTPPRESTTLKMSYRKDDPLHFLFLTVSFSIQGATRPITLHDCPLFMFIPISLLAAFPYLLMHPSYSHPFHFSTLPLLYLHILLIYLCILSVCCLSILRICIVCPVGPIVVLYFLDPRFPQLCPRAPAQPVQRARGPSAITRAQRPLSGPCTFSSIS